MTQEQIDAVEARAFVDEDVVRAAMARVPPSWALIEKMIGGGGFMRGTLQVIYTVQRYDDGRIWVHVSATGWKGQNWYLPDTCLLCSTAPRRYRILPGGWGRYDPYFAMADVK